MRRGPGYVWVLLSLVKEIEVLALMPGGVPFTNRMSIVVPPTIGMFPVYKTRLQAIAAAKGWGLSDYHVIRIEKGKKAA